MHINIHISTINEKTGHEFGREEVQVFWKVWREEREGGN